jgi:hypothetical protein
VVDGSSALRKRVVGAFRDRSSSPLRVVPRPISRACFVERGRRQLVAPDRHPITSRKILGTPSPEARSTLIWLATTWHRERMAVRPRPPVFIARAIPQT